MRQHPLAGLAFFLTFGVNDEEALAVAVQEVDPRPTVRCAVFEFINGVKQVLAVAASESVVSEVAQHLDHLADADDFAAFDQLEQVGDDRRVLIPEAVGMPRAEQLRHCAGWLRGGRWFGSTHVGTLSRKN